MPLRFTSDCKLRINVFFSYKVVKLDDKATRHAFPFFPPCQSSGISPPRTLINKYSHRGPLAQLSYTSICFARGTLHCGLLRPNAVCCILCIYMYIYIKQTKERKMTFQAWIKGDKQLAKVLSRTNERVH